MEIIKKINRKQADFCAPPMPVIAFLGDSVTQGCFDLYMDETGNIQTVYDEAHNYISCLSGILKMLYPTVPVTLINAGISGDNAPNAATRLSRDVLRFSPDLTVVCFGLNDCNKGLERLPNYSQALQDIFCRLKEAGSEVIFMTPNMMNTYVSCHIHDPEIVAIAEQNRALQQDGVLDAYLAEGVRVARACGVTVCDVYSKWKLLAQSGVDTTALLSNFTNHPTRKMSWLMALSLIQTMLEQ